MTQKLSLKDLDVRGKKVLMRVDFNVPLDAEGHITDDSRIQASLPSIKDILKRGGALILMSHLGRPKGKPQEEFSLKPCAKRLEELLKQPVIMAPDCVGKEVEKLVEKLQPGQVLLLENLRFHQGEEHPEKDPDFVDQLSQLGDVYVNDAFGTAHREHASTFFVAKEFPKQAAAGFLLQKEIQFLGEAFSKPERPFYAIIGGAKISSKIGVLNALLEKVDALFIGGAMAYTFFKAQGYAIGQSLCEDEQLSQAKEILDKARQNNIAIYLPIDIVAAKDIKEGAETKVFQIKEGIVASFQGVDIGPQTIEAFKKALKDAKTIFWNGPLGVFEVTEFAKGTQAIAQFIANLSGVKTIIGGGDSVAAIQQAGLGDRVSHLSTGGGASLEYIELGALPGIEALSSV